MTTNRTALKLRCRGAAASCRIKEFTTRRVCRRPRPPPVVDGYADAVIYQNSDEIGRAAIQLLVSLIHHNEFGIPRARREILVEGEWVDGRSLPP